MSTTLDYVEFVCGQIRDAWDVRYKKMFGEYMVYINDKPILLVCDNTVFVKKADCIAELMKNADSGYPYEGAKEHYILDIDDAHHCKAVIRILEPITPLPRPRKKKYQKEDR
ncbi:MAG: TfoX/Sxy family protein [Oscillospiraceae bacterium]